MVLRGLEIVCSNIRNARKGTAVQGTAGKARTPSHLPSAVTVPMCGEWGTWIHPHSWDPECPQGVRPWVSSEPVLSLCPSDYSTQRAPDHRLSREGATPSHHASPQDLSHQAVIPFVLLALRDSQPLRSDRSWASGNMAIGMWNVVNCIFS